MAKTSLILSIQTQDILLSVLILMLGLHVCSSINGTTQNTVIVRSLEDFDNPFYGGVKCGRNDQKSYICDPDNVLSVEEANSLDLKIKEILKSTKCPCSDSLCQSDTSGYLVTMALMNKMKLNISSANIPKQDDEHAWLLDFVLNEAKNLATALLRKWNLGKCNESVLVLYSRSDNVLYTVTGLTSHKVLTDDLIGEISMLVRSEFGQNITVGFGKLLNEYLLVFNGTYKRKTQWNESSLPVAFPVIGATGNSMNVYVYIYTLVTIIVTILMQL